MFSLKCTGDVLMINPPTEKYWDNPLIQSLADTDFVAGNLEMVLSEDKAYASTFCGGLWLSANQNRVSDLHKFHFDYFNFANNHTMDFSVKGADQTCQVLTDHGFTYSGYGKDLADANAAVFHKINGHKVAFVSCTASCDDAARAGNPSPTVPGRPGVNMLRHKETLYVEREYLDIIDKIAQKTCVNARFMKAVAMGIHSLSPEIHRLGRLEFVESDVTQKKTSCHSADLNRIIDEIQRAKNEGAEYVVVSVHSHDIKGMTDDTPDDYLEEFAHKCIDAGASVIIGTGTHQLKAVEIYRGAPIFYSLGNFVFRHERLEYVPADYYERYHFDESYTPEQMWNAVTKNNTVGLQFDEANYLSVVPEITFDDGRVLKVKLIPIGLGFSDESQEKEFPYIAGERERTMIFDRLKELSQSYGTDFTLENNEIVVHSGQHC